MIKVKQITNHIEFEYENTWKHYYEFALTPSLIFYKDTDVYIYYSIILHFLNIKLGITYRKDK